MSRVYQGFLVKKGNQIKVNHKKTSSVLSNALLVEIIRHFSPYIKGKLLDAGCGEKPFSLIYDPLVEKAVGVDVEYCIHDQKDVDVFASLDDLPFEDGEFDTVLCTDVLEHVPESFKGFSELGRVLKPGGHAFISIPFLYPLHESPHDYYRYTINGLYHRALQNGLHVKHIIPLGGPGLFAAVFFNLFCNKVVKIPPLIKLNCILQDIHFMLYKKTVFPSLISKDASPDSMNGIISLGYFILAEKRN